MQNITLHPTFFAQTDAKQRQQLSQMPITSINQPIGLRAPHIHSGAPVPPTAA